MSIGNRTKRVNVFSWTALLLLSSHSLVGQLPTKEDVAEEIRRMYAPWDSENLDLDAILQVEHSEGFGFGFRTAAPKSTQWSGVDSLDLATRRRAIKQFLDSMEYFHMKLQELHTSVEGDIGFAWGIHVEDFKVRARPPERVRVRFTQVLKKEGVRWRYMLFHRDIQPFDERGRYLTQFTQSALGTDNSLGTWKRNIAKSKSTPPSIIKSLTIVRKATDGGVTVKETGETMDGTAIDASYTAKYDGKEYSVRGQSWDTISIRQIDANTFTTETRKTGGKYHFKGRIVISGDGMTMTVNLTGTSAKGELASATIVFDKQS